MKRVGGRYLNPSGGEYAYDVPDDTNVGDIIVDELNRLVEVTAPFSSYGGLTRRAQRLTQVYDRRPHLPHKERVRAADRSES